MQNYPVWILAGAIGAAIMILPELMKVRKVSKVIKVTEAMPLDSIKLLVKGYEVHGVVQNASNVKSIEGQHNKDTPAVTYHGHSVKLEGL